MTSVPCSLRTWFTIHFVADMLFAIPLMFFPVQTLTMFGWTAIDTYATRLVAAALFGIGGASWWVRSQGHDAYLAMLKLKILWSLFAIIGLVLSIIASPIPFAVLALGIYILFFGVWVFYFLRLSH